MKEYESTLHLVMKGSVLNIQAVNGCVFTSGCICGDKLKIWQLEDDGAAERDKMEAHLRYMAGLPKPLYVIGQKEDGKK